MPNVLPMGQPARYTAPIPGVPDSQARALDRRHRLDSQLRSFQGPHRGEQARPESPFAVTEEAGPGPA